MSKSVWAVFLAAIFVLTGARRSESRNSSPHGGEVPKAEGLLQPISAATNTTLSVALCNLPVGKTIRIGDATDGFKFMKVSENQYLSIAPACVDELSVGQYKDFPYNGTTGADGSEQTFQTCAGHSYKLEVWGAQGGSSLLNGVLSTETYAGGHGGYGGYSIGVYQSSLDSIIHIVVGGAGQDMDRANYSYSANGGYNGGGAGHNSGSFTSATAGGGATHISTVNGLLANLESYKSTAGTNNSREILIVAGGGGGVGNNVLYAGLTGNESSGGGISGNKGSICGSCTVSNFTGNNSGATQTTGYAFGLGQTGRKTASYTWGEYATGGGGGGWYGGYTSQGTTYSSGGGGGGSGYIASSNLISSNGVTKLMKCYNCSTSTAASTYTVSVSCADANHDGNCANTGHGYARITRLN